MVFGFFTKANTYEIDDQQLHHHRRTPDLRSVQIAQMLAEIQQRASEAASRNRGKGSSGIDFGFNEVVEHNFYHRRNDAQGATPNERTAAICNKQGGLKPFCAQHIPVFAEEVKLNRIVKMLKKGLKAMAIWLKKPAHNPHAPNRMKKNPQGRRQGGPASNRSMNILGKHRGRICA